MRVRKKPWAEQEWLDNPYCIQDPGPYAKTMPSLFANSNPIHVELGCGKGRFITQTALRFPEINFIAVDRDPTIAATAARQAREHALTNVRFLPMDAREFPAYFNAGEIGRLYLNFSDPWPKKAKRAKRRLTHSDFLAIYESLAIAEIHFKTDNRVLFEFSLNQFSERGWVMRNIALDLHRDADKMQENIMTEYEAKFSPFGPIYRLEAYKF